MRVCTTRALVHTRRPRRLDLSMSLNCSLVRNAPPPRGADWVPKGS